MQSRDRSVWSVRPVSLDRTGRTGLLGHDSNGRTAADKIAGAGQLGKDCWDRTALPEQTEQNPWDKTAERGRTGKVSLTGHPGQYRQGRRARA